MSDISTFPLSAFRVFSQIPELLDNMESKLLGQMTVTQMHLMPRQKPKFQIRVN